jgi:hypothetical protein
MKLLAENRSAFERCIDETYGPEESIVCRYRNAVQLHDHAEHDFTFKRNLLANSIREGARIVRLLSYKGVDLYILDETSGMETGTLKAIDGCLTTSLCRLEGVSRAAFESGGNTGSALTRYGQKAGLETFFFCPLDNIDLLNSRMFDPPTAHLIAVEDRRMVKELAGLFATTAGIRHVPDKSWRHAAAMFRGLFILEQMLHTGKFDWISQAVSAGFGPIGIYQVFRSFRAEAPILPRFLGIQQEANCPMYETWKTHSSGPAGNDGRKEEGLLTRVMYDDSPQTYQSYQDLHQLLVSTRGDLSTVNAKEFDSYLRPSSEYGLLLDLLMSRGIAIKLRSGKILEKTGMLAIVGTLKAIDADMIPAGSSVLCCLTSGVSAADGAALPERIVRNSRDVLDYVGAAAGGQ